MTVKTLIEKLSHYNKNAIVRLHHREGEELLFALAFQNDDTTVVLEMVRKYLGDDAADHMKVFCIEHGLI